MSLSEIVTDLKTHFESSKATAETFLAQHLPALADVAQKAEENPVIAAVLSASHLSPAMLGALADVISKADADLAAAQPPPAPEPEPAAEAPAAEVPAEAPADGAEADAPVQPDVVPVHDN